MENWMRKSVVLFVSAVGVVLTFIVAPPYSYAASLQSKREQSAPATSQYVERVTARFLHLNTALLQSQHRAPMRPVDVEDRLGPRKDERSLICFILQDA
jgi:hypothetical protein